VPFLKTALLFAAILINNCVDAKPDSTSWEARQSPKPGHDLTEFGLFQR
jgi:hypothetical protein